MMKQRLFAPNYQASATRATLDLKAKTLLSALMGELRDTLSLADSALTMAFADGVAPHILILDRSADIVGRVTIDAESGLYVFCQFGNCTTDIVIASANENRLVEEIVLHLCRGYSGERTVDAAVDILVGQTIGDVERKLILQTLHHCNGDPTHTAFMLGMPLVILCNKLAVYFAESASELSQTAADAGLGAEGYRL